LGKNTKAIPVINPASPRDITGKTAHTPTPNIRLGDCQILGLNKLKSIIATECCKSCIPFSIGVVIGAGLLGGIGGSSVGGLTTVGGIVVSVAREIVFVPQEAQKFAPVGNWVPQ